MRVKCTKYILPIQLKLTWLVPAGRHALFADAGADGFLVGIALRGVAGNPEIWNRDLVDRHPNPTRKA